MTKHDPKVVKTKRQYRKRAPKKKLDITKLLTLKLYPCRCGIYVNPMKDDIGYLKSLCKNCYEKAIEISNTSNIPLDDAIDQLPVKKFPLPF